MSPYPKLEETEDRLNRRFALDTDVVLAFCQEFIKENGAYCFTPYIVGEHIDPTFSRVPDHHQERLDGLKAYYEKEIKKRQDEKSAGLEEAGQPDEGQRDALAQVLQELGKTPRQDSPQ
jgi:hypothetical protein